MAFEAVLLAVGLRADEHRLLGDAVRRVRLLGIAVPESSSRNGTGVCFGYEQTVPAMTSLRDRVQPASSSTCAPMIRFAYQ